MNNNVHPFVDRETLEEEACLWLIRLDGEGELSQAEREELQTWAAQSPAHQAELRRISKFWNDNNVLTELSTPLYNKPRHERGFVHSALAFLFDPWRGGAGVALASVMLLALVFKDALFPVPIDARNGIYAAAIGEVRSETLVDGSVLQINTDSQVQVHYSENVRKLRLLRGEAHFEVAPDKHWPFEVYAGGSRVKAVGTAFAVRLQAEVVNVIVTEGKVDLATQAEAPPETNTHVPLDQRTPIPLESFGTLAEGEGVVFTQEINNLQLRNLAEKEITRKLAWREGYLIFQGEPLSLVVEELNRYQTIRVDISDPTLRELPIGGRFKVGELGALFDALENNFGIQVSRINEQHIQLLPKQ